MIDTLEDFIQKYKNAFVFVQTGEGKEILAEFKDNIPKQDSLLFNNKHIGDFIIKFNTAHQKIRVRFPKTGLYNFGDHFFGFLSRIADRQFKRSPHKNNTSILDIFNNPMPVNFDNINATLVDYRPKNKLAAQKDVQNRGGVALSHEFGVTISDKYDYDLYFYNNIIGHIKNDKITVLTPSITQEVQDFFGKDLIWK